LRRPARDDNLGLINREDFAMPQTDPAASWPNYREDDFVIKDYRFASGEVLSELRLHYRTMGTPRRDAAGRIVNGVLLLQGNTGTGANWLRPR
jgi:homoserine O-acetyltransferase